MAKFKYGHTGHIVIYTPLEGLFSGASSYVFDNFQSQLQAHVVSYSLLYRATCFGSLVLNCTLELIIVAFLSCSFCNLQAVVPLSSAGHAFSR